MTDPKPESIDNNKKIEALKACISIREGLENSTIDRLIEWQKKWLSVTTDEEVRLRWQATLDVLESFSAEDRKLIASSVLNRLSGIPHERLDNR